MFILLTAFGLAMDAFAASISSGAFYKKERIKLFTLAALFGVFQAFMPVLGWLVGAQFYKWLAPVDHWIAFVLLGGIGVHMFMEASEELEEHRSLLNPKMMLLLALATSIDALAVGFSFSALKISIVEAAIVIGLVTFGCSLAGVQIGRWFGESLKTLSARLGGLVLVGLGVKILLTHLLV